MLIYSTETHQMNVIKKKSLYQVLYLSGHVILNLFVQPTTLSVFSLVNNHSLALVHLKQGPIRLKVSFLPKNKSCVPSV